ncbi:MAG: 4-hydroxythreonine-4-phosphate dehydrogenase PdxA [Deltaproteobacteria bacterium]|nr:4-hydroxythreonine-4-phosphate dehydrogenase PdxA [Deltaproteobacteria bacterium]
MELSAAGTADGIVTAPISKAALAAAGSPFPGHTEMLSDFTATHPPVMMLAGPDLRVVPLTIHVAIAEVPALLTRELVEVQLGIVHRGLRRFFGIEKPRIALCGLNPHAGEEGMFGQEEIEVLGPAIAALRKRGVDARGPFPADTVFRRAVAGEFDAVAAPTHDQALIPIKLLHFDKAVNVTLGLPLVRTSPDHGTAPDIAGQGVASPASMIAAIRLCRRDGDAVPRGTRNFLILHDV